MENTVAIAAYLSVYAEAYRGEYDRLTTTPPIGAGYPRLTISPLLAAGVLECVVSTDGVVMYTIAPESEYHWWIAGGPALMVDYEPTRTPQWVTALLQAQGIFGKPIGIYRMVSKVELPSEVWRGELGPVTEKVASASQSTRFSVVATALPRREVVRRLTFGAFVRILDAHFPKPESPFWFPHIIRKMGFMTADRVNRRFFEYLEILHHGDAAAWDQRAIQTRVQADVRRDFGWAFGAAGQKDEGGSISFGAGQNWVQPFFDRLTILATTLQEFGELLEKNADAQEEVFHAFIKANTILLDVYADAVSKPRWYYPAGASPLGKAYVEPDFVLKYPDGSYRLVELERPGKIIATKQGQPRADVNQAAFQIAEWKAYIANHYDLLKKDFPGIAIRQSATIVISRSSAESFGEGRNPRQYKELLASQYPGVDILTYDELLLRARQAQTRLATLGVADPQQDPAS